MLSEKRKRSANFSDDEKFKFLQILSEKGETILSKLTSHDTRTNRLKEKEWMEISNLMNATGNIPRSVETLKKLWTKLKSDAKTHKSLVNQQLSETLGEPSDQVVINPILDLVIRLTGRAGTCSVGIQDCDDNTTYEDNSRDIFKESPTAYPPADTEDSSTLEVGPDITPEIVETSELQFNLQRLPRFKKRQPRVLNLKNCSSLRSIGLSRSLAFKRVLTEKEKIKLIKLRRLHEIEQHNLNMQHKKRLFELKEDIMKEIYQKLKDGVPVDAEMIKHTFATTE